MHKFIHNIANKHMSHFETLAEEKSDVHDDISDGPRSARSIKEVLEETPVSNYTGSEVTRKMVEDQIRERWGEEEAKNYNPYFTFTYREWVKRGFKILRGETSIKSITFREVKDEKGNIKKYMKTVHLFIPRQTERA